MGKQLDSLADVVSFGVAPGMILYMLSAQCTGQYACILLQAPPFIMVAFSAIRLAKFNIDTRQSDSFIGLPTPANAMFIASIPLIMQHSAAGVSLVFKNPYFLLLFPIVSAYLLVAELPLIALKFKSFSIKGNEYRYALIVLSVLSVITLGYLGVAVAIILYILLSILQQLQKNKTTAS